MMPAELPTGFASVEALEDFMTEPSQVLAADLARVTGDIVVLGVAGKMGPTLARMAKRAAPGKRVVGVARFSDAKARAALEKAGVETIAADLLDRNQIEKLPTPRQRCLHGRHEVRLQRQPAPDLGNERACACHGGGGVRQEPDRCVLHGVRLPLRTRRKRGRNGGDAGQAAAGRLCGLLRRPRAHVRSTSRSSTARRAASCASTTRSTCAMASSTTWR